MDMVRNGREDVLADWPDEAEDSMIASLARGLCSDCAAVANLARPDPDRRSQRPALPRSVIQPDTACGPDLARILPDKS